MGLREGRRERLLPEAQNTPMPDGKTVMVLFADGKEVARKRRRI